MISKLRTDRGSELFIVGRGMLRKKIKGLKLRHRFQLRHADLNSLADELALELAKADWDREPFPKLPITPQSSSELRLIFSPSAQKRRN